VKLFSKKPDTKPLKTLNEREIQERLYGTYHGDQARAHSNSTPVSVVSKVEITRPELSVFIKSAQEKVPFNLSALILKRLKQFPWKFAGILIGSVLGALFVFHLLSFWIGSFTEAQSILEVTKAPLNEANIEKKSLVVPVSLPSGIESTPPSEVTRKKHYVVQVCTYFRESDARRLTQELASLNFPAFYQKVSSGHYLVFLGKEETYSAAEAQLQKFKTTKQFESFPDSFISSL
jgi:hypothetical protein